VKRGLVKDDGYCIVCGRTITSDGVKEMYYGIPIDAVHDKRVNICAGCLDRREYRRFVKACESGKGDDYYHLEVHEPKEEQANV